MENSFSDDINLYPLTTLCQRQWNQYIYSVETDGVKMCCKTFVPDYHFNDKYSQFENDWQHVVSQRQMMLEGKRPRDCVTCWALEDQGKTSFRQTEPYFIESLRGVERPAVMNNPFKLEIILAKTCDMSCLYCSEQSSTTWQKKLGRPVKHFVFDEAVRARVAQRIDVWWPNLSEINFLGGEPLIQDGFYMILDDMRNRSSGMRNPPVLIVTTNLNAPSKQIDRFIFTINSMVTPFDVYVSLDAIGALGEQIREGLNFSRFDANLDRLLAETSAAVTVQPAMTNLCLPGLKDLFNYLNDKMVRFDRDIFLNWNLVVHPTHLSPVQNPQDLVVAYEACRNLFADISEDRRRSEKCKASWRQYGAHFKEIVGPT